MCYFTAAASALYSYTELILHDMLTQPAIVLRVVFLYTLFSLVEYDILECNDVVFRQLRYLCWIRYAIGFIV